MPEEYVIKLTQREKDSLKCSTFQEFLIKAESEGHPYWTHSIKNIIEQINEQNNTKQEQEEECSQLELQDSV
tara:strand:- start:253 stop:468 length:216 start_codon:yes stop_codon:yes gene_type:complete